MTTLIERIKIAVMCWSNSEWVAFIILIAMFALLLTGKVHIGV